MAEYNSYNIYSNLNDQQFRLNKISEVRDYVIGNIKERELMSKRLSKHIASFGYFDKSLIVLSVTTGSISIASFAAVIGAPAGIAIGSFILKFLISTGVVKKLLKTMWNKKKKHNKIIMLASTKLNSTENKISEALINNEISHEDFMTIINEKKNYREFKESIRMMNSERSDIEKKITWLKKVNKETLITLLNAMNLLITVESLKYKTMLSYCLKCKKCRKYKPKSFKN